LSTGFIGLQCTITVTAYYDTSAELDARLATVPQPVFHYNILLASLAIDHFFSEDSNSIFQQLPGYQPQLHDSNPELRGI
jgi:hypothetical protein